MTDSSSCLARIVQTDTAMSNATYTFEVDSSSHGSNMSAAGAMAVDVYGGRAFTINGLGNVGIGTDSPEQKLHVEGASVTVNNSNDDSSVAFQNSATNATWRVGRDYSNSEALTFAYSASGYPSLTAEGLALISTTGNVKAPAVYNLLTASAANMHIDSNGWFYRSTSSLKYKTEVRDYDKGLDEVMKLKPKYYKGKTDGDTQFAGLIAEDVHDVGLTEFVQYADDGTPDALAYSHMIALLTKSIQELKAEIDSLKAQVNS